MPDDEKKTDTDEKTDADEPTFPEGVDAQLCMLISFANLETAVSSPVTVWAKGIQFAGQIAGAKEANTWFIKTFSHAVQHKAKVTPVDGMTPETEEALLRGYRSAFEKIDANLAEELANSPRPKRYNFLSLKKARVWGMPGNTHPTRPEMVRIRLDQIDAFMLGEPSE